MTVPSPTHQEFSARARVGALDEPVVMPSAWWVTSLALVNLAVMSGWFGPIQVLLAEQARAIDATNKEAILSLVLGVGAAVSTISNPIWGAFSDRTRSRRGRRVPWLIGGLLGGAASLMLLSIATNVWLMVVAWAGVQATLNMMFAGLTASVPDQVPVARRGLVGGVLNVAQTFGVVLGVAIAGATGSIASGYAATAAVVVALSVPFILSARDPALPADYRVPPLRWGEFVRSFWISPRQHPDFAWAWITRFAINLGNNIGTMYLLYYVTDGLGVSEQDGPGRVFILTGVYAGCTLVTAVVFGIWSDRLGRRKIFVTLSGIVAGVGVSAVGPAPDLDRSHRCSGRARDRVRHLQRCRLRADHPGPAQRRWSRQGHGSHQYRRSPAPGGGSHGRRADPRRGQRTRRLGCHPRSVLVERLWRDLSVRIRRLAAGRTRGHPHQVRALSTGWEHVEPPGSASAVHPAGVN